MGVVIVVTLVSSVIGICLNTSYQNKYYESAIVITPFIAQCVFLVLTAFTIPDPDVTKWFILWCTLALISFIFGIISCINQAQTNGAEKPDIIKAIIAQIVLPFGVALIVLIIVALIVSKSGGKNKS